MKIDPHVHCRDGNEVEKATIAGTLQLAEEQGVDIIFDMPNTNPPIIDMNGVNERWGLVPIGEMWRYFMYIGATSNPDQLEEAVSCYNEHPRVIGIKMFAGKSVGSLAIPDFEQQRIVYQTLARLGYNGVLAVHCEKESLLKPEVWDPTWPGTHCCARPKEAEIESVKDQIQLAQETGFKGVLHICHISCPKSVDLVGLAKNYLRISCGVTPHHIMWDSEKMSGPDGISYKMNPPLRDTETVYWLRKCLSTGRIDWIETDQAPHTYKDKHAFPHLSGYPSLTLYREFVEDFLPNQLGLDLAQIIDLTYTGIVLKFGPKLRQAGIDV